VQSLGVKMIQKQALEHVDISGPTGGPVAGGELRARLAPEKGHVFPSRQSSVTGAMDGATLSSRL
jgi:hypothetical protein